MSLDEALSHLTADRDTAITIGVFDGVHRGHRHLIGRLVEHAQGADSLACVVTFKNHPITVLKPDIRVDFLTDFDERKRLLRQLGVDMVVPIKFDQQLAQLSSQDFLQVLYEKLRMRHLVVGPDFAMGHNRDGSIQTLPGIARHIGFSFSVVDLMTDPSGMVKSTTIRRQIAEGDVSSAARLLGRHFAVRGVVVRGLERGRVLGFPTANIKVAPGLTVPGNGIYATRAHLDSGRLTWRQPASESARPSSDGACSDRRGVPARLLGRHLRADRLLGLRATTARRGEVRYGGCTPRSDEQRCDADQRRAEPIGRPDSV